LILVGAVLVGIVQLVQEYWPFFLVVTVLGGSAWLYSVWKRPSTAAGDLQSSPAATTANFQTNRESPRYPAYVDPDSVWLPAGTATTVAGYPICGGLLYVGKGLAEPDGSRTDAALINPALPVAKTDANYILRQLPYWSFYSGISPEARAAYLKWLAAGRSDPAADVGYVFLYFYGLERRLLVDAPTSAAARAEVPAIKKEIERLLGIYANSDSFQGYAESLLSVIEAQEANLELPGDIPPPLPPAQELSFKHRLGLGLFAKDSRPLPAEWAYIWLMGDPTTNLRTPAQRCPEEFKKAFIDQYKSEYGNGMKLPVNKTRLKVVHRPASPSLLGNYKLYSKGVELDLPDVTVLTSQVKKLQQIANTCMAQLEGYSRYLGRNPDNAGTADALVELPFALWPEQYRKPLNLMRDTVQKAGKPLLIKFEKLRSWLPEWNDITRPKYQTLARALGEAGIGIEPDLKFGGKLPATDSQIALFADDGIAGFTEPSVEYGAAALTLHLAVAVSAADGQVDGTERQLLMRQLEDWLHLGESAKRRLHAHLRLMMSEPPGLNSLKKRIETLNLGARKAIGDFLARVAQADNEVTPAEVKLLERIFKMLELDVQSMYSKVHAVANDPVTVMPASGEQPRYAIPKPPAPKPVGIEIDMARVAALRADSEKVSSILGSIFIEDVPHPEPAEPQPVDADEPAAAQQDGLIGLDAEHTALLRLLCTRAEWARVELDELAADRGLMLDGALERINDAAFDAYDQPFAEGEDPVEINEKVRKEILK
jgi:uncharacterized tellurite resistance protein B-like protein